MAALQRCFLEKLQRLTLHRSQRLCNPRWPSGVFGDAIGCWHLNPAPGPHLSVRVEPAKRQSFSCSSSSSSSSGGAADDSLLLCPTFPLLTFSEQLRMYIGIAMTTSSQACTVPALHWDMGVVLASSTCCRRSSWSSEPSDRLRRVGLERLSESGGGRGKGDGFGWQMCSGCGCEWTQRGQWVRIKKKAKWELQCEANELNINPIRGEWILMASAVHVLNLLLHDNKATFWHWCCSHSYHFLKTRCFHIRSAITGRMLLLGNFHDSCANISHQHVHDDPSEWCQPRSIFSARGSVAHRLRPRTVFTFLFILILESVQCKKENENVKWMHLNSLVGSLHCNILFFIKTIDSWPQIGILMLS